MMSENKLIWILDENEEVGTYEGIEEECINCGQRIAIKSACIVPICPECRKTREDDNYV